MNKEELIIAITKELQLYNKVSLHTLGNISDLIDKYESKPIPKQEFDPQQLWDEYSEYIDDSLFSLESVAGGCVIKERDFMRMFTEKKLLSNSTK